MPGSLETMIGNSTLSRRSKGRFTDTAAPRRRSPRGRRRGDGDLAALVHRLACGISSILNTVDPEVLVIGGGIARAGPALFEPLARFLDDVEWRPYGASHPDRPRRARRAGGSPGRRPRRDARRPFGPVSRQGARRAERGRGPARRHRPGRRLVRRDHPGRAHGPRLRLGAQPDPRGGDVAALRLVPRLQPHRRAVAHLPQPGGRRQRPAAGDVPREHPGARRAHPPQLRPQAGRLGPRHLVERRQRRLDRDGRGLPTPWHQGRRDREPRPRRGHGLAASRGA